MGRGRFAYLESVSDARSPLSAWLAEGLTLATVAAKVEKGTAKRGRPQREKLTTAVSV